MTSRDIEVYEALGIVFDALRIGWYVFGGQAAILHGAVRFTEDLDVTVRLGDVSPQELVRALAERGLRDPATPAARRW